MVEPGLLESVPDAERKARVEQMLRSRFGKVNPVEKVEPVVDPEQEVTAFLVVTSPTNGTR
jgi:hypothetical protein